jgi:hypothetical protein
MLGFYLAIAFITLGFAYVIGTLLYHTDFARLKRAIDMDNERLVDGEVEANQSFSENVK